ncbi:ubiquitin carboxyl-terminal hydrolase family protein [Sansalvadorimonas verongulae]|uniref:ubiquitin carboxyl-terminal hydrolase n=1 Tax=Sansalvadorimonas verongulae TaxID=2172824 RepID=UPI0012BBBA0C|nr:ubiquitin carboxyl-terminal hydrolase [Sansalvadorimonas verongulae]MTI12660.1 hypothetical protein [Sansalvadorimonas verongulae]
MDFHQVPGTPPPSPPPSQRAQKRPRENESAGGSSQPTVMPSGRTIPHWGITFFDFGNTSGLSEEGETLSPLPDDYETTPSKKPKVDITERAVVQVPLKPDTFMMRPSSTPETLSGDIIDLTEDTSVPIYHFAQDAYESVVEVSEVSSSGLQNRGNTCFMNAAMQAVADLLSFHGIPQEAYSQEIPQGVFQRLNRNSLPFYQLRTDTLNLCEKLNTMNKQEPESWNSAPVEQLMDTFIGSYVAYENAKNQLTQGEVSRDSILNHSQQDPQEFLDNICEVLGLNQSTASSVLALTFLSLEKDGNVLTRRLHGTDKSEPERSTLLALPIPEMASKEVARQTTLNTCVDKLLEKTDLEIESRLDWSQDDLVKAGLIKEGQSGPTSSTERMQLLDGTQDMSQFVCTFTGSEPPRALIALAKLSQYDIANQKTVRRSLEGKALLKNLDKTDSVTIPFYKAAFDAGVGRYTLSEEPPVQQKYNVRSIVVHHGQSAHSGHYVTVQKRPEGYVVYNDSHVSEPQHLTLSELFHGQPVCGYIFALQAVESTDNPVASAQT